MKRREFFTIAGLTAVASLVNILFSLVEKVSGYAISMAQFKNPKQFLFFDLWKLDYLDNCNLMQEKVEFVQKAIFEDKSVPNKGAGKSNLFPGTFVGCAGQKVNG